MKSFPRSQTEDQSWILHALDDLIAYCKHCGFEESVASLIESRKSVAKSILH
jgi:hypothetical protein